MRIGASAGLDSRMLLAAARSGAQGPTPMKLRARAFTLIELLVVIAVIALLIGILLPALSRARAGAQTSKCLSNCRQMGLSMTLYANDSKSWYPVMPVPANLNIWASQWLYGGVSGLFSLEQ